MTTGLSRFFWDRPVRINHCRVLQKHLSIKIDKFWLDALLSADFSLLFFSSAPADSFELLPFLNVEVSNELA